MQYATGMAAARMRRGWVALRWWSGALALLFMQQAAFAIEFEWPLAGGVSGTLNTRIEAGAQWRVEERSQDLVGKANNNPDMCPVAPNGAGTSCQGHTVAANPLHAPGALNLNSYVGEGTGPNQAALATPGQFSTNADDGNLNYDRGELTQAIGKVAADLNLTWRSYGLFLRGYYFHDTVNHGRDDFHPNTATQRLLQERGPDHIRAFRGERGEFDRNKQVEEQVGEDLRLLDANVYGNFPFIGDREITVRVGRQPINWGESTVLIVNSLNTFNPPNVNALFRPAFLDLAEVLQPVEAVSIATGITESLNLEAFYQYEWEPVEIAAPGSYLSTVDVGSDNARDYVFLGFGKVAENTGRLGIADQVMLSAITDTRGTPALLPEKRARDGGQYGIALRYYAEQFNNGTEFGFYYANYHSRLPYLSSFAGDYGCASGPGAPTPAAEDPLNGALKFTLDAANFLLACPGADALLFVESALPVGLAPPVRDQNIGPDGDAYDADTIAFRLEYPEDIKLYGVSFNTSFGELSLQGEIAYRPNAPLQVDDLDLAFAALQNVAPWGFGSGGPEDRFDFGVPAVGVVAQLPTARYTIPDFVSGYRGRDPYSYAPGERIRGWEYFRTAQYNLGGTYIVGPNNWFRADQILLFGEIGATQVFDLPGQDELQIDGPGTFTHASAGADGTGADGSKQSNSGVIGPSGIRFNPTQQQDGFADDFAWGYRVIGIFRYQNVLPGISFEPTVIWAHDVSGTAPGPGENFVDGRKSVVVNLETRVRESWSFALGYTGFYDGGPFNLLRDRDYVQAGVRYQF